MTNIKEFLKQECDIVSRATPGPWIASRDLMSFPISQDMDEGQQAEEICLVNHDVSNRYHDDVRFEKGWNNSEFISHVRTSHEQALDIIEKQDKLIQDVNELLLKLDEWHGKLRCEASVYNITDDELGNLPYFLHTALDLIHQREMNINI